LERNWPKIDPKLFKIGLQVFGLRNVHFWKEIGQKLAQNVSKLGSFFALKKWPFLERNWPKIGQKLFKIGLLFCLEEMAIFGNKLANN